jgi:hypothetical protein
MKGNAASDASEVSDREHASCHLSHFEIRQDDAANKIANFGGDASVLPHLIASWCKACSRSSSSLTLRAMWGRLSAVGFIDATPITAQLVLRLHKRKIATFFFESTTIQDEARHVANCHETIPPATARSTLECHITRPIDCIECDER